MAGIRPKSVSDVLLLQTHKRPAPFDHNFTSPRAGGGAGMINYQPGPAGRPAGRGGTTLT